MKSFEFLRWAFYLLIAGAIILLAKTNGRAGWIGGVLSIFYILPSYQPIPKLKQFIVYFSISFLTLILPFLFWYKSGSSGGRLLIYKISGEIFKQHWLFGIGNGQFKVRYNQYQADYFSRHNIYGREGSLADNSFYAFNDFLQLIIENGIIGLLLLAAMVFSLLHQIKNTVVCPANKHLFTAAKASLICISTGSLFSYPLQMLPIIFQAALCLAIISTFQSQENIAIKMSEKSSNFLNKMATVLSLFICIHYCFHFNYKYKSNQAFELNRTGFKQKALEKYREVAHSYIKDGNVLQLYAQELYYRNYLREALQVVNKAKQYYCSNEVYKLSATIENELQNFDQAEKDYKTALYMVPNRMVTRTNLMEFYMERKDTFNAIYWANSILNMPVKVPSKITQNIQRKTKKNLLQLSK